MVVNIDKLDLGLVNELNQMKCPPGSWRSSYNILPYQGKAVSRRYLRRAVPQRADTAVTPGDSGNQCNGLIELRKTDGTNRLIGKFGTKLYYTGYADWTSISTGLTSNRFDACQGNDRIYLVDGSGGTNRFYSTASGLQSLVSSTRPTAAMTLTETGSATGFGTGVSEYNYTLYSNAEGWETRPKATSTTITKANANQGIQFANPSDAGLTGIYDRYRLYRRLQGENAWYLIATINPSSGFPYTDTTPDADLTNAALSEIYDNESGLEDFFVPSASIAIAFFRDRIFIAQDDYVYWSKVNLPFLFRTSDVGRRRIGDDGDQIVRIVVYNESLVVFKTNSIWVMNGDVTEENFTFYPASRSVGSGFYLSEVITPTGIFFIGTDRKIYRFDLTAESLSKPVTDAMDITGYLGSSIAAGFEPKRRNYVVSNFSTDVCFAINVDTYAIGPLAFTSKSIRYFALVYNGGLEYQGIDLVCGDYDGLTYIMERDYGSGSTTSYDGRYENSKVSNSHVGSVTSNTLTLISGTFETQGDGLKCLPITIVFADGTSETHKIASNTSTQITITDTWTTTPRHWVDKFYIGGYTLLMWLNRIRPSMVQSRFDTLYFYCKASSSEVKFGATVDEETSRTKYKLSAISNRLRFLYGRRGYTISPFIEAFGTEFDVDLGGIDIDSSEIKR